MPKFVPLPPYHFSYLALLQIFRQEGITHVDCCLPICHAAPYFSCHYHCFCLLHLVPVIVIPTSYRKYCFSLPNTSSRLLPTSPPPLCIIMRKRRSFNCAGMILWRVRWPKPLCRGIRSHFMHPYDIWVNLGTKDPSSINWSYVHWSHYLYGVKLMYSASGNYRNLPFVHQVRT